MYIYTHYIVYIYILYCVYIYIYKQHRRRYQPFHSWRIGALFQVMQSIAREALQQLAVNDWFEQAVLGEKLSKHGKYIMESYGYIYNLYGISATNTITKEGI